MTREEAINMLNVNEKATITEIENQYNELYSDARMHLTQAPTPNLKKLYQKNLQELEEAKSLLLSNTDINTEDLGSKTQVIGGTTVGKQGQSVGETRTTPPPKTTQHKPDTGAEAKHRKLTLFLIVSLVVGVSGIFILFTLYSGAKNSNTKISYELEFLQQESKELTQVKARFESFTKNLPLKVSNKGSEPFTIKSIVAIYRNSNGEFVKYETNWNYEVKPGATHAPEVVSGSSSEWDGSVIFYSLLIRKNNGEQRIHQSGFFQKDAPEGTLKLDLDNF
jgi:hypothetical protein